MAGKRAITPAMREHLRIIGQKGGKTTATRWGGWAAPHASRKARGRKAPSNVPSTSMRARTATVRAPAKVTDVSNAATIAHARVLGLPPGAFGKAVGTSPKLKTAKNGFARLSSRKTKTTRAKKTTRGY
jgi:hypothetical protein